MPHCPACVASLLAAAVLGVVLGSAATAAVSSSPDAEECASNSGDTALLQVSRRAVWGPSSNHPLAWLGREKKIAPGEAGQGITRRTFKHKATVAVEASSATDLQDLFEVLPGHDQLGWMGANSDASLVIRGGRTGHRMLWVFADTFIAHYDPSTPTRQEEGTWWFPRNTIGIQELHAGTHKRKIGPPTFHWRLNESATGALDFFSLPKAQADAGVFLWPVAGIATRTGTSVFLLALRLQGISIVGTTGIAIPDVVSKLDPKEWEYTTFDIPSDKVQWFSSIFYADDEGDTVYIFGHEAGLQLADDPSTYLARARLSKLLQGKWEDVEYWSAPGKWSCTLELASLLPIDLPTWESTVTWSKELHLWYSFNIPPLSSEVNLWTAKEITGNWSVTKVYDIPAPFNDAPWVNYAAKSHPELTRYWAGHHKGPATEQSTALLAEDAESGRKAELVFTYISNVLSFNATVIQDAFYGAGNFELPKRCYWPRFVRVHARSAGPGPTVTN